MDPQSLLERKEFAIELARQAGKTILESSKSLKKIELKDSFADLVTETDKGIEKFLFEELKRKFPNDRFIGEESMNKEEWTNEPTWIIDPIDGTTNFVHTFPYSCVSIGLSINKQSYLGIVYNPSFDRLYVAVKGEGAYLFEGNKKDGIKLQVRNCSSLDEALVMSEFGGQRDDAKKECVFRNLEVIGWRCHGVRSLGSAAMNLCAVASGHADAYYEFGLHIWDMAAAALILNEAGGYACDTRGGPLDMQNRRLIGACNEHIAKQISTTLPIHLDLERD